MDEATAMRACEPFFTTKGPDQGTGLGLPMVKAFARRYGGDVQLVSRVGQGTLVKLRLMGTSSAAPAEQLGAGAPVAFPAEGPGRKPDPSNLDRLFGCPVLLAEDETSVRRLVETHLRAIGAVVTSVGTAGEACDEIRRRSFDLMVTDAVMPGGGTTDAIALFREKNESGRVLVVSGHVQEELLRRGIETGEVAFLAKPFGRDEFLAAVSEVMAFP